jgi:hypothetical protein
MIDHAGIGVANMTVSAAFYDAALAPRSIQDYRGSLSYHALQFADSSRGG